MGINFSFNVTKKIIVNGREYGSIDEVPEDIRHVFEQKGNAAGTGSGPVVRKSSTFKINFNGKEYSGVGEMPEDERRLYSFAMNAVDGKSPGPGASSVPGLVDVLRFAGAEKPGFLRWLFPRTLLKWVEPAEIRQAFYENQRRRFGRLLPWIIIGSVLVIWMLGRNAGFKDTLHLYLAAGSVVGVIFLIFWMGKVTPVAVSITDTGIIRGFGDNATVWKYKNIDRCEIASVAAGGRTLSVLVLYLKGGRRSVVGVDSSISPDDLRLLLEGKGVKTAVGSTLESASLLSGNSMAR